MSRPIGYARIAPSEPPETEAVQTKILEAHGVDPSDVCVERVLWNLKSPKLQAALERVGDGDVLVVDGLYRLGNSARSLVWLLTRLEMLGGRLRVLRENIETGTKRGQLFQADLGMLAGLEVAFMRERQREGIERAKLAGSYKGRYPSAREHSEEVYRLRDQGMTFAKIGAALGISETSAYQINKNRPSAPLGAEDEQN